MRGKLLGLLVVIVALAGCSSDGGLPAETGSGGDAKDVVSRYIDAGFDGKWSTVYDLLHPEVQARTSRDAFIACAAKSQQGVIVPKVAITEVTAVRYKRTDGREVDSSAVSVTLSAGSMKSNFTMWVVDGRLVDSAPASDAPCASRL